MFGRKTYARNPVRSPGSCRRRPSPRRGSSSGSTSRDPRGKGCQARAELRSAVFENPKEGSGKKGVTLLGLGLSVVPFLLPSLFWGRVFVLK